MTKFQMLDSTRFIQRLSGFLYLEQHSQLANKTDTWVVLSNLSIHVGLMF